MFPLLPSLLLCRLCFFFLMIRRPPRSTLFPTRRSSDLRQQCGVLDALVNPARPAQHREDPDRKSTRLNSSHQAISYAVFCLKKTKSDLPSPLSPAQVSPILLGQNQTNLK